MATHILLLIRIGHVGQGRQMAESKFGAVDILVNNAGISFDGNMERRYAAIRESVERMRHCLYTGSNQRLPRA